MTVCHSLKQYRNGADGMELQQLRHFLAAVRLGNVGKAAEDQNITQSGLSRSILNLERQLDLTLLKRNPRGVEPTAFGLSLIPHAEAMLNKEHRAKKELESLKNLHTGTVSLGITLNYSHYFVPDIITQLLAEYPSIQIEVRSGSYMELAKGLQQAELDFVFGLLASEYDQADICIEELFTTRSIIVANCAHPLVGKRKITTDNLSNSEWAMLSGEGFQRAFTNYFYVKGSPLPYQAFKTNSLALLKKVVSTRELLTILPKEVVAEEIADKRLAQIKSETPADFTRAGLIYRSDGVTTPAMKLVMDQLREKALEFSS